MGSPTGVLLECRPSKRAASRCALTSFPEADDPSPHLHMPEEYLYALEEERRKIDAFRRELPICMQLLHDAIESYKEKLAACNPPQKWPYMQSSSFDDSDANLRSPNDRVSAEENLPSTRSHSGFPFDCRNGGELLHNALCKPEWITARDCAQAEANSQSHSQERCQTDFTFERASFHRFQEQAFSTSTKPFFHSKTKSGGAFTPFSRDKQVIYPTPRLGGLDPMDLTLTLQDQDKNSIPSAEITRPLPNVGKAKSMDNVLQQLKEVDSKVAGEGADGSNDSPSVRKARRCWSPELHRRFVNALQQLGGSQVATPKQIRELMQVEGLTNDEVKSHLQKYRLHTRRPSPSQTGPSPQGPQVVVLGGIWVPPKYAVHAAGSQQQAPILCNSSQRPPHMCQMASSQELCSDLGSLSHLHLPPASLCDQKLAPAHSQSCPLHFTDHSALTGHRTVDAGREESVGDDIGSDTSSCKGCPQVFEGHGGVEMEDERSQGDSINGYQSNCTSEDGDSRGSDTALKMV